MLLKLDSNTLRQLELLKLRARRSFLGTRQGGHVSLKRGHGIEFSDYRQYELGDDPRHIDWGVYGRSDRLYIKRFQEEQDLTVAIIIDSSASMFVPNSDQKWFKACQLALALAYVALLQQDRVLLLVPGQLDSGFVSGGAAFAKLTSRLEQIKNPGSADFVESALKTLGRLSHPGLTFVISDFLIPLASNQKLLQALQSRNLEINALQLLGRNDLHPFVELSNLIAVDSESGSEVKLHLDQSARNHYEQLLTEHNFKLQNYCSRHAIKFVQCYAEQDFSQIMFENIAKTGLFQ